jgi:hypothetical protein
MATPTMCQSFGAEVNQALFMFAPEYMGGTVQQVSYGDRDGCRYQKDDLIIVLDGSRVSIKNVVKAGPPAVIKDSITTHSVWGAVGKYFYKPE